MNCRTTLQSSIHFKQTSFRAKPGDINKHQQQNKAEQANATARLTPPKDRAVFGVAVSFFVMVFAANTLALLYFFANEICY
jgi:hypothetical protein